MENGIANPVISSKTKHTLTMQFSSQTPWLMPQRHENLICIQICSARVFIAAVFMITKIWKQPKSLSVNEWINYDTSKLWNIIQC